MNECRWGDGGNRIETICMEGYDKSEQNKRYENCARGDKKFPWNQSNSPGINNQIYSCCAKLEIMNATKRFVT